VLSPFLSLISDQVNEVNKSGLGLDASLLDVKYYEDISAGKFNVVIGTPEAWLLSKRWKDMLSNSFFRSNLICIIIDEVYLVTCGSSLA